MDDTEKKKDEGAGDTAKKPAAPEVIKDEDLEQVTGGTVSSQLTSAVSEVIKSVGDALASAARKG